MDLSQIMKMASDPQARNLLSGVMNQFGGGKGGGSGLNGLLGQLTNGGMGSQVQSWIGKGENDKVSGEQIEQALGSSNMEQVAAKAGTTPTAAADGLASMLPQLVDQATPNGQMPSPQDAQDMMSKVMGR